MAERPGIVRIGDRVVFSGAEYSVVALSGSLVRLVADSGETAVVAMAYLAGAPDFAVVGAGPRARVSPAGLLEALPGGVADAAREWERHLAEVETGLPPGAEPGTAPEPEFDPVARTLTERAQAKADELGVSLRTVERMLRRYRNQGLWGLVDTRHAKRARPAGNVDPRVVAAAVTVIDAQTRASTGTKSRAVRQIKELVEDEHGPGNGADAVERDVLPAPGRAVGRTAHLRLGGDQAADREPAGGGVHPDHRRQAGRAGAHGRHPAGRHGHHGRRGARPARARRRDRHRDQDALRRRPAAGRRQGRRRRGAAGPDDGARADAARLGPGPGDVGLADPASGGWRPSTSGSSWRPPSRSSSRTPWSSTTAGCSCRRCSCGPPAPWASRSSPPTS